MTLSASCDETLKNAEKKVNELMSEESTDNVQETDKVEDNDE